MRQHTLLSWMAVMAVSSPVDAALCTLDQVPAATLLVPYFEASIDCVAADASDTAITVYNPGPDAQLARLTLWTNAAVPAFGFDVYLNGRAQQRVSLRALFCDGVLPSTGSGLVHAGQFANPPVAFAGCNTTRTVGGSPVYAAIDETVRAELRAAFSGTPSLLHGSCSSIATDPDTITGYVTIDSVNRCNAPRAGQDGFEAALAASNGLAARAELADPAQQAAVHYAAVALEAAADSALDASPTFYGTAGAAGDRREPLPSTWGVDAAASSSTSRSELLIWRDPGQIGEPFACDTAPTWYPLTFGNRTGFGTQGAFRVNDIGVPTALRGSELGPLATQRVALPAALSTAGWVYLNLQHAGSDQGWLARIHRGDDGHAALETGTPLDSGCSGPAFDNTNPGNPAQQY